MSEKPTCKEPGNMARELKEVEAARERAEKALKESEERYRSVLDTLNEGVFLQSASGEILSWNKGAEEIFGIPAKEIIGRGTEKWPLIHEDGSRSESIELPSIKTLQTGKPYSDRIFGIFRPSNDLRWISINTHPLFREKEDKPYAVVTSFSDITGIKKMDERLLEAQKMESIGTLAGGIAHDFNNILGPIILHAEMAKDDLPEDAPLKESINEIYKASIRARDLVKQILTFARKGGEKRIILQAGRIIKDTVKFLRSTIPATIEIRHENRATLDTVLADPIQLNQVVMNLCTNAAYAMREKGGLLKIFLDNKDISARHENNFYSIEPGPYLKLTVSDSGRGMSSGTVEKIFEPYFTTKDPGEGTGLGLSVIHGIVKSYGGSIDVESSPGKGTTFHVYLPLIDEETTGTHEQKADIPKGFEQILLVDDEKSGLDAMRRTLENLGYRVIARSSSIDAFKTFRNDTTAVDLVITDMTMPYKTGKELIHEIKKLRPDLPTILYTGFSDQIDEKEAEKYGIDAFIMKPVIRSEIAKAIRDVLNKRGS